MKQTFKVALFQMAACDDLDLNLQKVESQLDVFKKADVVVLPEMWSFLIPDSRGAERYDFSKKSRQKVYDLMKKWAMQTQTLWVGGTVFEPDLEQKKVKNCCWVFDEQGGELNHYSKMHLFDNQLAKKQFSESKTVSAGEYCPPIDLGELKLGLGICYDLRFPYHFQALSEHGANVIALPAAFNYKTGEAHWEVLLRARAIENQCFILACNQTLGGVEGVNCWGHSMVINPWGEIVAQCGHEEKVLVTEIDLNQCDQVRTSMPVLSHRLFKHEKFPYDPKR